MEATKIKDKIRDFNKSIGYLSHFLTVEEKKPKTINNYYILHQKNCVKKSNDRTFN